MLPNAIDFDEVIDEIEEDTELDEFNGYSYLYDFEVGDFVYVDGEPLLVYGEDAVRVWIEKALRTRLKIYDIYSESSVEEDETDREYGSNLWTLVRGRKMPHLFLKAEIIRDIEETMAFNSAIKRVDNFYIAPGYNGESSLMVIEFDVILQDDEMFRMEVDL